MISFFIETWYCSKTNWSICIRFPRIYFINKKKERSWRTKREGMKESLIFAWKIYTKFT